MRIPFTATFALAILVTSVAAPADDVSPSAQQVAQNGESEKAGGQVDESLPRAASRYRDDVRDAVDAAAPIDSKTVKLLQQAETLLAEQKWDRALEVLLFTLDRGGSSLVRRQDGSLAGVAAEANDLLNRLPDSVMGLYRRQYGPAASKALADAVRNNDRRAIERIARQFRHTDAGHEAVLRVALDHFDRGEFGLAAVAFRQLEAPSLAASMRVRAAYACAAAGRDEEAAHYLASLTDQERQALSPDRSIDDLMSAARRQRMALPIAENWLLPQGSASGTLTAPAGDPVLLQRWSHPLTERPLLQRRIEHTERELRDGNLAGIPTAVPLAIGDRVVSRTLRGLAVRSLADGRLLWESVDEDAMEPQSGFSRRQAGRRVVRVPFQFGPNPSSGIGEHRSMTNELYRNGVRGFLSSDGKRVYAVEDLAGSAANRIVAFDLATGRPAWSEYGALGGLLTGGRFLSPLAGYTFFGPPTPIGGDLYVVGEHEKEIRLIAMDPETGNVRWECPVANAQTGIEQDPVRRDWPAPVAGADGVLVCSTTVGWVMGIDPHSQSVLWAYRLTPPQPNRQQQEANAVTSVGLNERWCPSAPIIFDGRVYVTPPEEARLVCLDLFTGELIWQRSKGSSLYVAGLAGDLLVTVGVDSVAAVDPASGSTAWSLPVSRETGLPSGRAVLTREHICLPVDDASLWIIDATSGELLARKRRSTDEPALGNLVLHRGTLLSLSASGLTAFEERTQLLNETQERLKRDPQDATAFLRLAELDQADGNASAALARLSQIDAADLDSPQTHRFRQLRWEVLETLARSAPEGNVDPLAQMADVAETADERLTVRRLEADRASAAGDTMGALRAYRSLIENVPGDAVVKEDGGRREVRLTEWLAGRMLELRRSTNDQNRTEFDREIRDCLNTAATDEQRDRMTTIFAFHPAAAELLLGQANAALESGRLAEAELRLLRLRHHPEPAVASAALDGLVAAARTYDLVADEDHWQALPASRNGRKSPVEAPRPSTVAAAARLHGETRPTDGFEWGDFRLTTIRSGGYTSSESVIDVVPEGAELPYFRDRSLRLSGRKGSLAVSGPSGIGLAHSIPLPMDGFSARRVTALAEGHVVFLLHNATVQAISPVEGRVLWTAEVPDRSTRAYSSDETPRSMRPAGGLSGTFGLIARSRTREALPIANASYVALCGRGELVVLDPLTGDVRWSRNDLPHDATVIGTESVIYVLPRRDADGRVAYLAIDGQKFPMGRAGEHTLPHAVASVGDRLLTVVAESPPFRLFNLPIGRRTVVALQDPRTNRAVWSHPFAADTLFDMTVDGRLCALNAGGELFEIQAETGAMKRLGTIPAEVLRGRSEAYLLTDRQATYVIVNSGSGQRFFAAETPAIPVNGHVFAFDREQGRLLWRREVTNKRLLCQEFDHQPVLLLIDSDRTNKGGQGLWQLNLLALDKRSGRPVLDEPYYSTSTPFFQTLTVRPDRRTIELIAYNMRLRLQAVESTADRRPEPGRPTVDEAEAPKP